MYHPSANEAPYDLDARQPRDHRQQPPARVRRQGLDICRLMDLRPSSQPRSRRSADRLAQAVRPRPPRGPSPSRSPSVPIFKTPRSDL
ncbi:hypothetical protein H9P43_007197 [Blastocladiella emersonii ATCC 22665]|nr:hypothetical protein H9P43_007197 [Blastocladiella emersonii ATCC 22665]